MTELPKSLHDRLAPIARIIGDAGGEIVGRTKLQKTAYLLTLAGFEDRFRFGYKHYGPFSDELASMAELAAAFDLISEQQKQASWGGSYSVYSVQSVASSGPPGRIGLARAAAQSDALLLELAATAAYLAQEGKLQPWAETARRKPDKAAEGRLDSAKTLYAKLRTASGDALPEIVTS